jgi:xanthine dehydrogenase YagS FAD-binding subunit
MLPAFAYIRPASLADALGRLEEGTARIHAGGTDLIGCLRDRVFGTDSVVSISQLDELRGVETTADGGLRIGALTTVAEVAAHPVLKQRYTALAEAAALVASPQLRNQGTLGGNVCQKPRCWYYRGDFHCLRKGGDVCYAYGGENEGHCLFGGDGCYVVHPSDTAPALVALGAVARVVGPRGARRIPLGDLFVPAATDYTRETVLAPNEILADLTLPPAAGRRVSTYRKVRARAAWDFALVAAAIALTREGGVIRHASIVLGGVAATPWRSSKAETALVGSRLDAATIASAADAAVDGAEPLEKNAYKVPMLRGLITERLESLA